eukprot:TRINITY_DN3823_c2_g1_i1.p1 TRINITY_DN3823_c2_g1~~TRINITY_DN3823_c2_g1_i1.p1  ORF type:complete len:690 (+),score=153.74 TRINITY_DN3823_c2_g1_i1:59-2071(+)
MAGGKELWPPGEGMKKSCCTQRIQQVLYRSGDTLRDVNMKLFVVICLGMALVGSAFGLVSRNDSFATYVSMVAVVWLGVLIAWLFITRHITRSFLAVLTVGAFLVVAGRDIHTSTVLYRSWPMHVLVLDLLLVLRAEGLGLLLLVAVALWIILMDLEFIFRFGILDLPGLKSYDDRAAVMECNKPPCAMDNIMAGLASAGYNSMILVLDFVVTRGFSRQVEGEQEKQKHTITVAQRIANSLASFDLEGAEEELKRQADIIPEDQLKPYQLLLYNLASYKPYLPQALVNYGEGWTESASKSEADLMSGIDEAGTFSEFTPPRSSDAAAVLPDMDSESNDDGDGCYDYNDPPEDIGESNEQVEPDDNARSILEFMQTTSEPSRPGMPPSIMCTVDQAIAPVPRKNFVQKRDVTLMRLHSSLQSSDTLMLGVLHDKLTTVALEVVSAASGVVDTLCGDGVHVSFNAGQRVARHAHVAVSVVHAFVKKGTEALPSVNFSGAVATGNAVVGTLGCSQLRRLVIIGKLTDNLGYLVDYGALRKVPWIVDTAVHTQCAGDYPMRLLLDRVKMSDAPPKPVSELLIEESLDASVDRGFDASDRKQVVVLNRAGRVFFNSGSAAAAIEAIDSDATAQRETRKTFRTLLASSGVISLYPRLPLDGTDIGSVASTVSSIHN